MAGQFHENQLTAIRHGEKPMLVLAGPGSGKTTVIIHRVQYLLEKKKIPPKNITVITFTKAAAVEMKERFAALGVLGGTGVSFSTFHSLFFRILRSAYGYIPEQILSEEEKWKVLRAIFRENEIETEDEEESIQDFIADISLMKNELATLREFQPQHTDIIVFRQLVQQYERYKQNREKIDFDDMLVQCYHLLSTEKTILERWQEQTRYILIDEFQDINKAQYECVKLLALPENNLFVVGDDDQSIYHFRGARPEFLLNFPKEYPNAQKVVLDINYRSTSKIIALSAQIIRNNKNRFQKEMKGNREEGKRIVYFTAEDTKDEAVKITDKIQQLRKEGVSNQEIAVIYRTNIQGSLFATTLADRGIAYELKDAAINIYRHWIAKDILAYLALAQNPENDNALLRIINKPKRYVGKELLSEAQRMSYPLLKALGRCHLLKKWQAQRLMELGDFLEITRKRPPYEAIQFIRNVIGYDDYLRDYAAFRRANLEGYLEIAEELLQAAKGLENFPEYMARIKALDEEMNRQKKKEPKGPAVTLSTMHSAKGLEFEAVFVPSIVEGIIPHEKSQTPEEIEEERRLFYVAATRAKNRLYFSTIKKRHEKEVKSSRFLKELGLK